MMSVADFFDDCLKDFTRPVGWESACYYNDVCPSFRYKGYEIFVDHPDPKERELGEDRTRFSVTIALDYGESVWRFETDDLNEVLKEIEVPYLTRPLRHDKEYYIKEELILKELRARI